MLTDHYLLEDSAARAQRDAADSRHLMMKCALAQPISIPAGFADPIQAIAKARKAMADDRARAGVVLPFEKKAAPSPSRPLLPEQPMRPAARTNPFRKLAAAPDTKHAPAMLDANERRALADLFRKSVRS